MTFDICEAFKERYQNEKHGYEYDTEAFKEIMALPNFVEWQPQKTKGFGGTTHYHGWIKQGDSLFYLRVYAEEYRPVIIEGWRFFLNTFWQNVVLERITETHVVGLLAGNFNVPPTDG